MSDDLGRIAFDEINNGATDRKYSVAPNNERRARRMHLISFPYYTPNLASEFKHKKQQNDNIVT